MTFNELIALAGAGWPEIERPLTDYVDAAGKIRKLKDFDTLAMWFVGDLKADFNPQESADEQLGATAEILEDAIDYLTQLHITVCSQRKKKEAAA